MLRSRSNYEEDLGMRPSNIVLLSATSAFILLGCGGSVSSAAPSDGSRSAAPEGSLGASEPAVSPETQFGWDGDEPAVSRAMTGVDEAYINPGAVIDDDGTLHMYANLFTNWPGDVQTVHLSSTDGATWDLAQDAPVLHSDDVPFARPGHDVSTGFVAADGTWVLVFVTVSLSQPWEIGIATAPGPDGPWTVTPEPVVSGEQGSWDAGGVAWPSVVPTDDGYAMYYSTYTSDPKEKVIARATSSDGLTWIKDANPVLEPTASWEGTGLDRPRVVRVDDRYVMVYSGTDLTDRGVAFSTDGLTWERDGEAPAITMEGFPVDGRSWDAALIERDGVLTYYLEIGTATASIGTEIYRATAPLP
jgi:predicted GH43/DUF377 family glycosyl hydrolase